jgi:transposase
MRAYSKDLRSRIVKAYLDSEGSQRQLALRFSVSLSFVRDLLKRVKETGTVEPKQHAGGQPARVDHEGLEVIDRFLDEQPSATLTDLCRMYEETNHVSVSRATMSRAVNKVNAQKGQTSHKRIAISEKHSRVREMNGPRSSAHTTM